MSAAFDERTAVFRPMRIPTIITNAEPIRVTAIQFSRSVLENQARHFRLSGNDDQVAALQP
jgi:hypothetical protein